MSRPILGRLGQWLRYGTVSLVATADEPHRARRAREHDRGPGRVSPTSSPPRSARSRRSSSTAAGCGVGPAPLDEGGDPPVLGPVVHRPRALDAHRLPRRGVGGRPPGSTASPAPPSSRLANVAAWGSLWVAQFVILDRFLFRPTATPATLPVARTSPTRPPDDHDPRSRRDPRTLPRRAGAPARRDASRATRTAPGAAGSKRSCAVATHDPAWVRPCCSRCCSAPRCSTSGASARRAGRTPSTRPRCRPATKSWKAFFFGSFDASNSITVDKSPAVPLGDGALGAGLRRELVEHPRARGARRRRRGRRAVPRRCAAGSRPARRCSRARCSRSRRSRR